MPDNSDKVSNVSAGVESGRQAPGASGAGGHKDDKRDGHKTPRKGPSGVKKKVCFMTFSSNSYRLYH